MSSNGIEANEKTLSAAIKAVSSWSRTPPSESSLEDKLRQVRIPVKIVKRGTVPDSLYVPYEYLFLYRYTYFCFNFFHFCLFSFFYNSVLFLGKNIRNFAFTVEIFCSFLLLFFSLPYDFYGSADNIMFACRH